MTTTCGTLPPLAASQAAAASVQHQWAHCRSCLSCLRCPSLATRCQAAPCAAACSAVSNAVAAMETLAPKGQQHLPCGCGASWPGAQTTQTSSKQGRNCRRHTTACRGATLHSRLRCHPTSGTHNTKQHTQQQQHQQQAHLLHNLLLLHQEGAHNALLDHARRQVAAVRAVHRLLALVHAVQAVGAHRGQLQAGRGGAGRAGR